MQLHAGSGPADPDDPQQGAVPADWKELLTGASPGEILGRLLEGDPFGIARRAAQTAESNGWIVHPARLIARAAALVAYRSFSYRGAPPIDHWLDERVHEAAISLVEEEEAEELARVPIEESAATGDYASLARLIDADPAIARLTCCIVNSQPIEVRRIFHAVVIDGRSLESCAAAHLGTLDFVRSTFERVTMRIALAAEQRGAPPPAFFVPPGGEPTS